MTRLRHKIICGNSETELKQFEDNTFDSCVTDPPYNLTSLTRPRPDQTKGGRYGKEVPFSRVQSRMSKGFMSKEWDGTGVSFKVELWEEVYRVMKPGAHILVFGGDRTEHRMKCGIEDAGFTIRGTIPWIFSSGFPKSLDISKAIDKLKGEKREVYAEVPSAWGEAVGPQFNMPNTTHKYSYPASKEALQWNGWGTGLKPAVELICMARKELSESNIASNVLKWGTGGININGCRINFNSENERQKTKRIERGGYDYDAMGHIHQLKARPVGAETISSSQGRYPANLILSCDCEDNELIEGKKIRSGNFPRDRGNSAFWGTSKEHKHHIGEVVDKTIIHTNPNCVCRMLDEQSGVSESKKGKERFSTNTEMFGGGHTGEWNEYNDKGGSSRFFYQAKASQNERWFYCTICNHAFQMEERDNHIHDAPEEKKYQYLEFHPTQKPLELIRYLVRLITPPSGIVLDPFVGTGTTLVAAEKEGFSSIGIDSKPEYCKIAARRIKSELGQLSFDREISTIERIGF